MYRYKAYGLGVHSDLPLPELNEDCNVIADITVRIGKITNSPLKPEIDRTSPLHCFQLNSEGMYLYWQGVGTFLVKQGKEIYLDPSLDADEDRLRLFILGAAIGVILHQRGFLVLHGSAVAIHGNAVIFLGDKGWGKSTMAAAMHARDHQFIADDVIAIDLDSCPSPLAIPAFPQLKLWPDAVASLGENPEHLPQLVPHLEKRDRRLKSGFLETAIPLQQIYVLGIDEEIAIKAIPPQAKLTYLIKNAYITRFGTELWQDNQASHFLKIMQLAQLTAIDRLLRPANLSLLPTIAKLLEDNLDLKKLAV